MREEIKKILYFIINKETSAVICSVIKHLKGR